MKEILESISQYDYLIEIISCVFTVLALVFTLYFWLLDHLSEDESKFIEGKEKSINELNMCLDTISDSRDPQAFLDMVQNVNNQLEVILNYRFWPRSRQKEEYKKINEFFQDSKYLISTIRRYIEAQKTPELGDTLIGIASLNNDEIEDIQSDYKNGLRYIINFIEAWN